jgi:hypothetical protein
MYFPDSCSRRKEEPRTEELLAGSARLDDLDESRSESLDGGDMVGENTSSTGHSWDVDLGDVGRGEDGLLGKKQASGRQGKAQRVGMWVKRRS